MAKGKCEKCERQTWSDHVSMCKTCSNKSRTLSRPSCEGCGVAVGLKAKVCKTCHNKRQNKGLSRERTLFNVSSAWRKARQECFERDDFTCRKCGKRGGQYLHAHHRRAYSLRPDLRLDVRNLLTMCVACHREHHSHLRALHRICGDGYDRPNAPLKPDFSNVVSGVTTTAPKG